MKFPILSLLKKILCLLSACFLLQKLNGQDKQFSIQLTLSGVDDGTKVYLTALHNDNSRSSLYALAFRDTVAVAIFNKNKVVLGSRLMQDGMLFQLIINNNKTKPLLLLLSAGEKVSIVANIEAWSDLSITGSAATTDWQVFLTGVGKVNDVFDSMDEQSVKEYILKSAAFSSGYLHGFLISHPDSHFSALQILMNLEMTASERIAAYSRLTPEIKNGYFGKKIAEAIITKRLKEPLKHGHIITDFEIFLPDGTRTSVLKEAAKHDYTLIDVWASWCQPCRAEIPILKRAYNLFASKGFNILGISTDQKNENWTQALLKIATPWTNGRDVEGYSSSILSITTLPTYILINRSGKLFAFESSDDSLKNFGDSLRGENLEITLAKLLDE